MIIRTDPTFGITDIYPFATQEFECAWSARITVRADGSVSYSGSYWTPEDFELLRQGMQKAFELAGLAESQIKPTSKLKSLNPRQTNEVSE